VNKWSNIIWLLLIFVFYSCIDEEKESKQLVSSKEQLFQKLKTNITFNNVNEDTKQMNVAMFDYFYNGAGVSIGDINNDNLPDIFFTGNMVPKAAVY